MAKSVIGWIKQGITKRKDKWIAAGFCATLLGTLAFAAITGYVGLYATGYFVFVIAICLYYAISSLRNRYNKWKKETD